MSGAFSGQEHSIVPVAQDTNGADFDSDLKYTFPYRLETEILQRWNGTDVQTQARV